MEKILEGALKGISQSLEAILILLLIGVLVGVWIACGTVPAMIYYGLKMISARYFLPAAMTICVIVAFAIGSWGTIGTVGLAFMGMGAALHISAPGGRLHRIGLLYGRGDFSPCPMRQI